MQISMPQLDNATEYVMAAGRALQRLAHGRDDVEVQASKLWPEAVRVGAAVLLWRVSHARGMRHASRVARRVSCGWWEGEGPHALLLSARPSAARINGITPCCCTYRRCTWSM